MVRISDIQPPTEPTISAGQEYVSTGLVQLKLSAKDEVGVTAYYVSETATKPAEDAAGWISVPASTHYSATSINFTLSGNKGAKTIYVWFKDAEGNISKAASDRIVRIPVAAPFAARATHELMVLNKKMYLIAGYNGNFLKDVWSSSDGVVWTEETNNAAFGRTSSQVAVLNDTMYLVNGESSTFRQVWKSTNAKDWTKVSINKGFIHRIGYQLLAFSNQLFMIGGYRADTGYYKDVWVSSAGMNWLETADGGFSERSGHQVSLWETPST